MSVVITSSYPSSWTWIPGTFPEDWEAEETGIKKYTYVQDGDFATWSLNVSWPGGFLREAVGHVEDYDTLTDAEVKTLLDQYVFFTPMTLDEFLTAAVEGGLDGGKIKQAMDNDSYVQRITGLLETGQYENMILAIDYHPSKVLLTQGDIDLLKSIVDTNKKRLIDVFADAHFVTAPGSITEAEVTTARTFI